VIVIGLTGSIGMGKSTLAKQFGNYHEVAVCDSDAIVHRLLSKGGKAVAPVAKLFPAVFSDGAIDRDALGREVFGHKAKLRKLEGIVHPLVREAQDQFIARAQKNKKQVTVLDIPLLFETGGEKRCDYTVVATASLAVQRDRVFARPNMTEEKFKRILALQMPDKEKRARADFVVNTGRGMEASAREVKDILYRLLKKAARKSR